MTRLWCDQAWVQGQWSEGVLLEAHRGHWQRITTGVTAPEDATPRLPCVVPGLVNAHSHAFQRAMAGMTERCDPARAGDDFWSWRERMYQVALRVDATQLETIAEWLYREMLQAGFTQVCEFHYLHRDTDGSAYAEPAALGLALTRAAQRAGMGLTLLPTLYLHRGLDQPGLGPAQRRFASQPDDVLGWQAQIQSLARAEGISHCLNAGVALHSLRAVDAAAMRRVVAAVGDAPIHLHIAEQVQEVEDCLRHRGQRPVEWLLQHIGLDARWNLVHATHTLPHEVAGMAKAGAAVVLCPSTEANLGDGVFDLRTALAHQLNWSIGTDSHVNRHPAMELQLLEYGWRLQQRQRNMAAQFAHTASTAAVLFEGALRGGSAACGQAMGGLCVGQRADAVALDVTQAPLLGVPRDHWLDAWVMGQPCRKAQRVWVAGEERETTPPPRLVSAWTDVMQRLYA